MDRKTAEAIADLANEVAKAQKILNDILSARCDNADENISENSESIEMNEEALNFVTEEILPDQNEKTEEIEATVDFILTEIIPSLMMGDE